MAYLLFTPTTRDTGMVAAGKTQRARAVLRIAQPLRVGWSLLRTNGTWEQKANPTTAETQAVDVHTDGMALYLAGGHWHLIDDAIYSEILAAGFTGTIDVPDGGSSAYPSSTTYPSATLYPGAA